MSKEVFGKQKFLFPYFYFYAFSQSLSVFLEKMSRDLSKKGKYIVMFSSFFLAVSELTNNHLKLSNQRDQHIIFFVFLFLTPAVFFLKRNTGLKKGAIIFRFRKREKERERTLNYVNSFRQVSNTHLYEFWHLVF